MKKYTFLIKPIFFICNLLFASWLVIKIESVNLSDFNQEHIEKEQYKSDKQFLKKICLDYKTGIIDNVKLDQQLEQYLRTPKRTANR